MQMEEKTTILLADDQQMVRQGIRKLIEQEADFEVGGAIVVGLVIFFFVRRRRDEYE